MYSVKPGETIWSIADKFEMNPSVMIAANALAGLNAVYSGQRLIIPGFQGNFHREMVGFCEASPTFRSEGLPSTLTALCPCWAELNDNGNLSARIDVQLLEEARQKRKKVYIHVQSFDFDDKITDRVLEKSQHRHHLSRHLLNLLEEHHLTGVNLHVRNVSPHNRNYLTRLIQELAQSLGPEGFSVMVTVPAKTGDTGGTHWAHAYDYHAIGTVADHVVIEAYDFHWADGHPGPIAPSFWVKDVLDYALMEISAVKIILGLPCYGYDWIITGRKRAQYLSYQRVMELCERHRAEVFWEQDAETPYFNYFAAGEEHQVWFENQDSLLAKLLLAYKYHLGGVALWRLGEEDPAVWATLQKTTQ